MGLREKYDHAIQTAKSLRMQGSATEQNGKLYFTGTVNSMDEVNQIWNALKTNADWEKDIIGDIRVNPQAAAAAAAPRTYTVKAGDTLGAIAKAELGNANAYMQIFEANKDVLADPNKIKPGQVLKIPAAR